MTTRVSHVQEAWQSVTGRSIDVDTDIFDVGASSVSVAHFIAVVAKRHGVFLTYEEVMRSRTVRKMEEIFLERVGDTSSPNASPGHIAAKGPRSEARTSLLQRRRLQRDQRELRRSGRRSIKHVSNMYVASGSLELAHVRTAMEALSARHDVLRSAFPSPNKVRVLESVEVELIETVLPDARDVSDPVAREVIHELRTRPFALDRGPCWRIGVVRFAQGTSALVFVLDHLLADGLSTNLFEQEFAAAYNDLAAGRTPDTDRREPTFYDWSDWQWELIDNGEHKDLLTEWRDHLDPAAPLPALVPSGEYDAPCPAEVVDEEWHEVVPRDVIGPALAHAVQAAEATPYSCVLAAYVKALAESIGFLGGAVNSVLVSVANRPYPQSFDIVGWLANTSLVRCGAAADVPYLELVRRVQQEVRALARRGSLPFWALTEELEPSRHLDGYARPSAYFDMFDNRLERDFRLDGLAVEHADELYVYPAPGFCLQAIVTHAGDLSLHARSQFGDATRSGVADVVPAMVRILTAVKGS
ncbi:condensation domain-containing protein [Allokutzneria sp. A3M-2-11 16]|uniref:condensation domain-containing protein n=1 Tax=Allokutzneria sp. A3M-2-11 16 TaxID=2962043 RepID=UPI0020B7B55D|nr:condensation domain-containing protein [Allokutzneria sp. A3M-2-11 16]MCP3803834.1 condensation domain-containing protein [Allokutzneria sp. A3M-2-11 16]